MHFGYFDTTRKGNHSSFLTSTVVGGRCPFLLKFALKVIRPLEKRRLRQISAYNVSTVGDSEKSSIVMNRKSTTGFPTSYRWSAYVTPKSPKGWLKKRFFVFKQNSISIVERSLWHSGGTCSTFSAHTLK